MAALHPLIRQAKTQAEGYRVRPAEHGFNIWRFKGWSKPDGGWQVIGTASNRLEAGALVLERLGLADPYAAIKFTPYDWRGDYPDFWRY